MNDDGSKSLQAVNHRLDIPYLIDTPFRPFTKLPGLVKDTNIQAFEKGLAELILALPPDNTSGAGVEIVAEAIERVAYIVAQDERGVRARVYDRSELKMENRRLVPRPDASEREPRSLSCHEVIVQGPAGPFRVPGLWGDKGPEDVVAVLNYWRRVLHSDGLPGAPGGLAEEANPTAEFVDVQIDPNVRDLEGLDILYSGPARRMLAHYQAAGGIIDSVALVVFDRRGEAGRSLGDALNIPREKGSHVDGLLVGREFAARVSSAWECMSVPPPQGRAYFSILAGSGEVGVRTMAPDADAGAYQLRVFFHHTAKCNRERLLDLKDIGLVTLNRKERT